MLWRKRRTLATIFRFDGRLAQRLEHPAYTPISAYVCFNTQKKIMRAHNTPI
jgi:hypothetical protein